MVERKVKVAIPCGYISDRQELFPIQRMVLRQIQELYSGTM